MNFLSAIVDFSSPRWIRDLDSSGVSSSVRSSHTELLDQKWGKAVCIVICNRRNLLLKTVWNPLQAVHRLQECSNACKQVVWRTDFLCTPAIESGTIPRKLQQRLSRFTALFLAPRQSDLSDSRSTSTEVSQTVQILAPTSETLFQDVNHLHFQKTDHVWQHDSLGSGHSSQN